MSTNSHLPPPIHPWLHAAQQLSQALRQAPDETAMIHACLRQLQSLTGAVGISFVPLDSHGQPLAAARAGEFPVPVPDAWLEYLASPAIRQDCAQCQQRETVLTVCPLLRGPFADAAGIYCLPVAHGLQELGVINIYFDSSEQLTPDTQAMLLVLTDITAFALESARLRQQWRSSERQRQAISRQAGGDNGVHSDLVDIGYQAVMEERIRLAREIHDGLAQTLGFLKLQLAQIQTYLERGEIDRMREKLKTTYPALAEAYLDVRQTIDELRIRPGGEGQPLWFDQTLAEFEENAALKITRQDNPDETRRRLTALAPEVQAQLLRIIQEALNNIRKHARASQVWLSAYATAADWVFEIRDDGPGFDPEAIPVYSQHGLRGMRERAARMGAELQVLSAPHVGTTVILRLPLEAGEHSL